MQHVSCLAYMQQPARRHGRKLQVLLRTTSSFDFAKRRANLLKHIGDQLHVPLPDIGVLMRFRGHVRIQEWRWL